jgi:hypothetical protein
MNGDFFHEEWTIADGVRPDLKHMPTGKIQLDFPGVLLFAFIEAEGFDA